MRAHGVGNAAARAGLQRTNVQRAMSGKTDPRLSTVVKLLGSARLRLAVEPQPRRTPRQRKRA
jgi:DNA-binding phage protein